MVTLDRVIAPAYVTYGWPFPAAPGHTLVAAVLTVHSPASAAAPFQRLYSQSRLVDSKGKSHPAKSTGRFRVTDCVSYRPFADLGAAKSAIGCEVFQLQAGTVPVELKVAGKTPADWSIARSAIRGSLPPVAPHALAGKALGTRGTKLRRTLQTHVSTSSTTKPGTTTVPGDAGSTTTSTGVGTTTSVTGNTGAGSRRHHRHRVRGAARRAPRINRLDPREATVGTGVVIVGRKLAGATDVTVDGVHARIVRDRPSRLQFVVPLRAKTGPVVVTTTRGRSNNNVTLRIY